MSFLLQCVLLVVERHWKWTDVEVQIWFDAWLISEEAVVTADVAARDVATDVSVTEATSVSENAVRPGLTQLWCSERRPRGPGMVPATPPAGTRTPGWPDEVPKRRATAEPGPCNDLDGPTSVIVERRRISDVTEDEDDVVTAVGGVWKLLDITWPIFCEKEEGSWLDIRLTSRSWCWLSTAIVRLCEESLVIESVEVWSTERLSTVVSPLLRELALDVSDETLIPVTLTLSAEHPSSFTMLFDTEYLALNLYQTYYTNPFERFYSDHKSATQYGTKIFFIQRCSFLNQFLFPGRNLRSNSRGGTKIRTLSKATSNG